MCAVAFLYAFLTFVLASATPVLYDGRAPFNLTNTDLNTNTGPYLTCVRFATLLSMYLMIRSEWLKGAKMRLTYVVQWF